MAGGSGTRFWPLSRNKTPKQVLSIVGENSLLRDTFNRLEGLVIPQNIMIVTNRRQQRIIAPHLPELNNDNYILEPSPRNTAPCIALTAMHLLRTDPDAIMVVLPSDHLIGDTKAFQKTIMLGIEVAKEHDVLVTIGIVPTRPATGYGYIQFDSEESNLPKGVHKVRAFAEKPNASTAERFIQAGDFRWNSGIFIWRAKHIIDEIEELLPTLYHQLRIIENAHGAKAYPRILANRYNRIRPISIDYGIMELTTSPVFMIEAEFAWSDIGCWDELYRISSKNADNNAFVGDPIFIDAHNNYVHSPRKLTAIMGLDNILVVNTKTATLICPLDRAQDVKLITERLRKEEKDLYL